MPELETILRLQRNRLLKREEELVRELERLFNAAIADLEADAVGQAALIERRIDEGANPLSAQLTAARTNIFIEALADVVADVAQDAMTKVLTERRALQIASANDFIDAANATDVHAGIDEGAVRRIGLALAADTPVRRLFSNLPELAAQAARDALFTGVAAGQNPRRTARDMARAAGVARDRASTIARTETLRAYRNAQLDRMGKTPEIERWVWVSARDRRTCAYCWAQHGRVFTTDRRMATHPNCRCSQGPLPKGANTTAIVGNGKALFDKLPAADQLAILGPAKFRAFKAGAIELRDLIGNANHPDWGPVGFERSLKGVLGADAAKKYYNAKLQIVPPPPKVRTPRAPRVVAPPPPPPRNPRPMTQEIVDWNKNAGWAAVTAHSKAVIGEAPPNVVPNALGGWLGRSKAKDHIATELGRRIETAAASNPALAAQLKAFSTSGTGYSAADMMVGRWAGTSADSDPGALAVQVRAGEKFGLPLGQHLERAVAGNRAAIDRNLDRFGDLYDTFLDAQYGYTQEVLKAAGVTELVLFRGQGVPGIDTGGKPFGYMGNVNLQPLSSFSVDPATSTFFKGGGGDSGDSQTMVAMRVPIDRILSTPITGYGCYHEGEFVVLGGADLPAHVVVGKPGTTPDVLKATSAPYPGTPTHPSGSWVYDLDGFIGVIPADAR